MIKETDIAILPKCLSHSFIQVTVNSSFGDKQVVSGTYKDHLLPGRHFKGDGDK